MKFPTDKTWCIIFNASKKSWHAVSEHITLGETAEPANGLVVTIHLSPDSDTEVNTTLAGEKSATTSNAPESSTHTLPKDTAAEAPGGAATSKSSQNFRPSPILLIPAPVGSTVRIEFSDTSPRVTGSCSPRSPPPPHLLPSSAVRRKDHCRPGASIGL